MKLKEKLVELKQSILPDNLSNNRDFEFEATLEDHPIGEENIYRLYYVNFHRFGPYYKHGKRCIGLINFPYKPFMLPAGMTREEGFKVLSYLTDFIEKREDTEPCSWKSVETLDGVLYLDRFGFTRVDESDESKIINLFTVGGRLLLFKQSKFYSKYFEWYTSGITLDEVKDIYAKYGLDFYDIVWLDKENKQENVKTLKK